MRWKPRVTIRFLLVATVLSAISIVAYRWWNIELEIVALPRPNSGEFTTSEAIKLRPEFLSQAVGVQSDHESIQNWTNPYFGFHIHISRDGAIRVKDQLGVVSHGQKSLDNARKIMHAMQQGSPSGVLLTSETSGWDQPEKTALVDSFFEPAVQIFIVRRIPDDR